MIKILVADDSETEAALITQIIESEPDMKVIGVARNGKEAVDLTARLKPDLIAMDIQMPIMNGLEATRHIMSEYPTPIVVISSSVSSESVQATLPILEAGALSALAKPRNIFDSGFEETRKHITTTLRMMSEIKVAKKRIRSLTPPENKESVIVEKKFPFSNAELLAIGVSVGGPLALKTIFSELPASFPLPIVVVQHMSMGFINGYIQWLDDCVKLHVKAAADLELLKKGMIYVAPDNYHLEVVRINGKLHAKLVKGCQVDGFYPSITVLLNSVAKQCGNKAIGALLTGMGSDGAQGLLEVKRAHGHTFIQDKESAVVFGMAGVAQSMGAVDDVVKLDAIANYLNDITRNVS